MQLEVPHPDFQEKKNHILAKLAVPDGQYTDLSPKGSIDIPIRSLIENINNLEGYVTTSSCSGRLSVYLSGSKKRGADDDPEDPEPEYYAQVQSFPTLVPISPPVLMSSTDTDAEPELPIREKEGPEPSSAHPPDPSAAIEPSSQPASQPTSQPASPNTLLPPVLSVYETPEHPITLPPLPKMMLCPEHQPRAANPGNSDMRGYAANHPTFDPTIEPASPEGMWDHATAGSLSDHLPELNIPESGSPVSRCIHEPAATEPSTGPAMWHEMSDGSLSHKTAPEQIRTPASGSRPAVYTPTPPQHPHSAPTHQSPAYAPQVGDTYRPMAIPSHLPWTPASMPPPPYYHPHHHPHPTPNSIPPPPQYHNHGLPHPTPNSMPPPPRPYLHMASMPPPPPPHEDEPRSPVSAPLSPTSTISATPSMPDTEPFEPQSPVPTSPFPPRLAQPPLPRSPSPPPDSTYTRSQSVIDGLAAEDFQMRFKLLKQYDKVAVPTGSQHPAQRGPTQFNTGPRQKSAFSKAAGLASRQTSASVGGKGGGGKWLFVSHDRMETSEIFDTLEGLTSEWLSEPHGHCSTDRNITVKFEPFILHVLTASPAHAQRLIRAANFSGFRETGAVNLTSDGTMPPQPIVAIRCMGLFFQAVIGVETLRGERYVFVSPSGLENMAVTIAERFCENERRLARFRDAFLGTKKTFEWEDKNDRRNRKRREGLSRRYEVRMARALGRAADLDLEPYF